MADRIAEIAITIMINLPMNTNMKYRGGPNPPLFLAYFFFLFDFGAFGFW